MVEKSHFLSQHGSDAWDGFWRYGAGVGVNLAGFCASDQVPSLNDTTL
jgi:hypothetical protein